jgi:hypothetical protein
MEETSETDGETARKPILLGGEDAMEEDENVDMPLAAPDTGADVQYADALISKIITPSPYPHHTTGATASRFRNAMSRIATHPTSDVEAWQAIITEANTCYRTILPQLHSVDADTHAKLDWIESCFGSLLKYFPYAYVYYTSIVEMLLAQSARVGEEEGPLMDYGRDPSQRTLRCETKVEAIFRKSLGVQMDGTSTEDDNKLGGMCSSSVELWLLYVRKRVRDANRQALPTPEEKAELVRQWSIDAYELAIKNCGSSNNNHLIWKQYLAFVKSWIPNPAVNVDHALAQKQMVQLRSVYQRLASHPMTGLDQLWQEYEAFERGQNEALAAALIAEHLPKYQHARSVYLERNRVYNVTDLQMGRLATSPATSLDEDYASKVREEIQLLTIWKKRCSYERTNPERLPAVDLVQRVRNAYKELACALSRHPEAWHMWAMWELHRSGAQDEGNAEFASAVLHLGQACIPDCTLLSLAEAQVVELHSDSPSSCVQVMNRFVERSPNTLGFVLYQQFVRRYKGIQPAREVFARARRVLLDPAEKKKIVVEDSAATPAAGELSTDVTEQDETAPSADADKTITDGNRRIVTNRLGSDIGTNVSQPSESGKTKDAEKIMTDESGAESELKRRVGAITWQLYASHAAMEHRLNHAPSVAARIYELGLRKHASFLTKPQYVLRYAQLLLELDDTENLRALLSRALAACQTQQGASSAEVAELWDMMLRFEVISSNKDASNVGNLDNAERRRRAALVGESVEDVSNGSMVPSVESAVGLGSSKSTIAEQLIRSEGYDVSSMIVNGLSRTVEVLGVIGVLGTPSIPMRQTKRTTRANETDESLEGGVSDEAYQQRLQFQALSEAGLSVEAAGIGEVGTKAMTARERLQQAAGGPTGPSSAAALVIQQNPEWLRPMLLLLPASLYRTAAMNKPPPHLIEMALSALRKNALPADRPTDNDNKANATGKRKRESGGDSSDEENGNMDGGGGYGSQFRSRRARQMGQNGGDVSGQ